MSPMPYGLKVQVGTRRIHPHRLIAEQVLGRVLPRHVDVHHIDGDTKNNAHSNLVICQDRAYHQLLHLRTRVVRAGGDPNTQKLCLGCRTLRLFTEFAQRSARPGGLQAECRHCHAARYLARRMAA